MAIKLSESYDKKIVEFLNLYITTFRSLLSDLQMLTIT